MSSTPSPERRTRPRVFHLGFTKYGSVTISDLFFRSGFRVAASRGEGVANDIFYSKRRGLRPLRMFPNPDLFVDMEAAKYVYRPQLFAPSEFAFLHQHFPDAYYVITLGDVDGWIAQRYSSRQGLLTRAAATTLGVEADELPGIWRRDWDQHVAACTAFFAGNDRFLLFDEQADGVGPLVDLVAEHYRLRPGRLKRPQEPPAPPAPPVDLRLRGSVPDDVRHRSSDFAQSVVEFATRTDPAPRAPMPLAEVNRIYGHWEGGKVVRNRDGNRLGFAVDLDEERWAFLYSSPFALKHQRTEGVLNEAWQHGARRALAVDMQDAIHYGTSETGAPEIPILTYCRRPGTAGLVLWPLPGYHSSGSADYPGPESRDTVAWADKRDVALWRGNLTGKALPELGPAGVNGDRVTDLLERLGPERDPGLIPTLRTVPRYRLVRRLRGNPDFDLAITLPPRARRLEKRPALRRFTGPRMTYAEMFCYRYLLSISGNDTGSNFLMAADSASVVLREEDGWELFYTSQFRPWEHYIPLVRGGDDAEEQLEWARSHPRECQAMSQAAREVVRRLVHPGNREEYLRGILAVYESRL